MNKQKFMKKMAIGILLVALIVIAVIFFVPWGNYESDLVKSDLDKPEELTDSTGNIIPTLDDLEGLYQVESGEGQAAELIFEIDGLKETKGAFEEFSVFFEINDTFAFSTLDIEIEAASVNTENTMRDESLVSDEFFDTGNYPLIQYHSYTLTFSDSIYMLDGELILMDHRNELSFGFKHLGGGTNDAGSDFEAFEGNFEFDRTEYGMPEESGVGNIVSISFYVELIKDNN